MTLKGSKDLLQWYVLRATYGRERKAYDKLRELNVMALYPTVTTVRVVNGRRKVLEKPRFPNLLFARSTEEVLKKYVYNEEEKLDYLRFYYRHRHSGGRVFKEPMVVPDEQMESIKIICGVVSEHVVVTPESVKSFSKGQKVRVVDGSFKGVEGMTRYRGQQRVGVVVDGLLTVATAYVPTAFLEPIEE